MIEIHDKKYLGCAADKKGKVAEGGKHSRAGCKRARPACEFTTGLGMPSKMCDLEKK
jgi:hypothetical protein